MPSLIIDKDSRLGIILGLARTDDAEETLLRNVMPPLRFPA
jgi:hypothetical protein